MLIRSNTPTPGELHWAELKIKLKAKFIILTDTDLKYQAGKKEEMLAKVQVKLGKTKDELAAIIAAL